MLKTLKRKIALVAVAALGAGGLSIVAAPSAFAGVTETVTGTVTPVRVNYVDGARVSVPAATLTFTTTAALADGTTSGTLTVLSAPTSAARLNVGQQVDGSDFDSLAATAGAIAAGDVLAANAAAGEVSIPLYLTDANAASGTYSGRVVIADTDGDGGGADAVTVNFSFTTTGAPASLSLDKSTASLPSVTATTTVTNRAYVAATDTRTFTTTAPHNYTVGNVVTVAGIPADAVEAADETQLNGTCVISAVTSTTFSCVLATAADVNITVLPSPAQDAVIATVAAAATAKSLVVFTDLTLSLLDASAKLTQPSVGDTVSVAVADATNIAIQSAALGTSVTITDANLADGKHAVRVGSMTTTADSETITFTPAGVLGASGVTAVTGVATTVAYGATTAVTTAVISPSSSSVIKKNTSAAQTDYSMDPGSALVVAETSGLEAGKAYRVMAVVTDVGGGTVPSGTVAIGADTASAFTAGTAKFGYGIAGADGKVKTTFVFTSFGHTGADTIQINVNTDDTTYTQTTDLKVTAAASAYAVTLTAPAVTPSVAITSSAIKVAGNIKDQYGNALNGATVTASGAQVLSAGTASPITGQAVTAADGTFSIDLAAANALTTQMNITVTAAKGGAGAITQATSTVNFNAGGAATAIAWSAIGDEDTATTPTFYPNIVVPFNDGVVSGVSQEGWSVAAGGAAAMAVGLGGDNSLALAATAECVAIEINTTPLAQVAASGSAGVLFSTTACDGTQKVSDLKATAEVAAVAAATAPNLWVTSTKTGKNTVTLTSGTVTKTVTFYAQNWLTAATKGDAARDIVLDSATKTLSGGEIGFVTATVVDTFGNIVEQATGVSTVKASITGAALLDGPSLSKSGLLADADGKITLGVIAGNAAGTATLTVTGVNGATTGQFGALVGAPTSTTTAGTNTAFKASANVKTATITVAAASSKTDAEVTAVKADVKAVSDTVKTLSNAVTTIQSSVTELTASFSAQIKSLSSAIAKISRAIAALSKRIK